MKRNKIKEIGLLSSLALALLYRDYGLEVLCFIKIVAYSL